MVPTSSSFGSLALIGPDTFYSLIRRVVVALCHIRGCLPGPAELTIKVH